MARQRRQRDGSPVGRRTVIGLLALGAVGVVGGSRAEAALAGVLGPVEARDPSGLVSLLPWGDSFRYYSVTGAVPVRTAATYRLAVSGLVANARTYTLADLRALPSATLVRDFHCVTGWQVPQVRWAGVRLSVLLERAVPDATAGAVRFHSFDGTYTESLTLAEARRPDVLVALRMLDAPISHEHGGPVRSYIGSMYGYKGTKWLSGIELTREPVPGYWEHRGYDIDGTIRT